MFSMRVARGAGVVKRGFWHSRSGKGSTCPAVAGAGGSAAGVSSWTSLAAVRGTAAVLTYRHEGTREARLLPTTAVLVLHQQRHLGSRSAAGGRGRGRGMGPSDTGRRSDARSDAQTGEAKDGEGKEAYEFLPKDDLGKLSSQSQAQSAIKPDTAADASASTVEKEEPGSVTLWQRWKNARAKMKLLWKQYGLVWIGTYTVLYFGGLAGIYVVLDTGLVASDVDTSGAIQVVADQLGAQDNANVKWLQNTIKTNPKANTLLKAVIVNELLEYPRDIVAIAATPSIARAIGRAPPKVKS